ncbi:MAG: uracil-DNA glycosylase [Thermodesulfovibrionales bacterium]|nr:uracil-DNA glycosylase [Thermodesulfovibrionales bacterium]
MKSEKLRRADLLDDLKKSMSFYQALGFESLPIKLARSNQQSITTGKGNGQSASDKKILLEALRNEIGDCTRCKLSKKRTTVVFGEGDPGARIMFIGEAPGREEDLQGRPFVGDAGMVLTRLINKMGFQREDVYIANIVKCRPPVNRDPETDEIEVCRRFLEGQIAIICPKVIVSLGRISAATLTGNPGLKITAVRGKFFDYKGIPVMPTFHPAYLMRNPKDKWLTWDDALMVLESIGEKAGVKSNKTAL